MGSAWAIRPARVASGIRLRERSDRSRWLKSINLRAAFLSALLAFFLLLAVLPARVFDRAASTPFSSGVLVEPRSLAAWTDAASASSRQMIDSKVGAGAPAHPGVSVVLVVLPLGLLLVVVVLVVVLVVLGGGKPTPPICTIELTGSPRKVATKKSFVLGSNSSPHGPTPSPEAKRLSVGLVVPSVG